MTTRTTSDEIFKQNLKCHKLVSQDPVKLVCASPKSSGQALVHYFCQNSTLSNVKKFNKTSKHPNIQTSKHPNIEKICFKPNCNIFSSCNPLPLNNCELPLPLRLPDYVSQSLVKMLSQTNLLFFLCRQKRIVILVRTNARLSDFLYLPNRNLSVIIFCDYFPWLFSVIIFFLPPQQQTMQRNAKSNVVSLWE